jgi:hypothetical protein
MKKVFVTLFVLAFIGVLGWKVYSRTSDLRKPETKRRGAVPVAVEIKSVKKGPIQDIGYRSFYRVTLSPSSVIVNVVRGLFTQQAVDFFVNPSPFFAGAPSVPVLQSLPCADHNTVFRVIQVPQGLAGDITRLPCGLCSEFHEERQQLRPVLYGKLPPNNDFDCHVHPPFFFGAPGGFPRCGRLPARPPP